MIRKLAVYNIVLVLLVLMLSDRVEAQGAGGAALTTEVCFKWVKWDANTEADLDGYKVYWGRESRAYDQLVDVGNMNSHILNLPPGKWYIAVTAYDKSRNESGYSNEVIVTIVEEDTEAPDAPKNLRENP